MFRLRCEVRTYLTFEVFAETKEEVMERFEQAMRAKAKKGGWLNEVQDELDSIKWEWIEEIKPSAWIDGEQV